MTILIKAGIAIAAAGGLIVAVSQCARHVQQRTGDDGFPLPRTASPNFDGRRFRNAAATTISKPGTLLRSAAEFITGGQVRRPPVAPGPFRLDAAPAAGPAHDGLRITWMGHSSALIEIGGKRFLTDPVWSDRASPVGFAGPQRFFAPPCAIEELPPLDGVIISHDHYDHLDRETVTRLAARGVDFYVPLGVGPILAGWGVPRRQIRELDWWAEAPLGPTHRLVATPAQHFSGRLFINGNGTLWCSWVIIGPAHRVFFGGDGGMFDGFAEIGRRYGPFDVTMLEIGAYHHNWRDIHLGPHLAIDAHLALRGKALLPIHWGTFTLAFHDWDAPIRELIDAAAPRGIALLAPAPGAAIIPDGTSRISRWWERDGSAL